VDGMKQSQVAFVREHKDLKEILVAVKIISYNCATELLQLHKQTLLWPYHKIVSIASLFGCVLCSSSV
jgi:hypothetical protein